MARTPSIAPYPVPHDNTARRLEWPFLPPNLRSYIERKCGSPVATAISQTSGFTPGFASVLVCEDGSHHFVKAASTKAQRVFADSYREEARKLAALPPDVPAPRLLWHLDDDWVVLGIEHVAARPPHRPWGADDLDAVLDALEQVADALTPPPAGLDLDTAEADFAPLLEGWTSLRESRADLDPAHLAEAEALARRYAEVVGGDTLVHTDVRSDNVLIDADGRALVCDWNWPVRGAAWFDSFAALIGPRGEGIDVDAVIAGRRLLRDVDPEAFDINLALYVGYFFTQCELPVPPTSPHIRDHQRWQGEVCWDWLAERRGWS
ncbi:phosphotransferase family protein [Nocardioides pinisoli]|uniref:Phosphotransferase n=1 Tax=Nocardioides pinisoli TaxID=2950279 RepID=A0ABT1KW95_9ACTN|nr:phosphotransferase [Nocardioides pinisoli]MCP3422030.1 phosphotransferase [Nocardioides pinisoli]